MKLHFIRFSPPPALHTLLVALCLVFLASFAHAQTPASVDFSAEQTNGAMLNGVLDFDVTVANIPCGPGSTYTQTTYSNFSFGGQAISGQQVVAQGYSEYNCPNFTQPASLPLSLPGTNGSSVSAGNCVFNFSTGNGSATCPTLSTGTIEPAYQVVSILYAPPGNQSTSGIATGTNNGTSSTYGDSFTNSQTITTTQGIPGFLSIGGLYGTSTTSSSSYEFVSQWQNAQGEENDLMGNTNYNPNKYDAINHTLDDIVIWLNPLVSVVTNEDADAMISYSVSSQPIPGVTTSYADVMAVPVGEMMPNSSGNTSVKIGFLNPQQIPNSTTEKMPGLALICKNVNLTEYNSTNGCNFQDQCGCTPADFAQIVAQDALLNYNTSNFTSSPLPGSGDPLSADASGAAACNQSNPLPTYPNIPTNLDCRYVIIPETQGSTNPYLTQLSSSVQTPTVQTISDSYILTSGSSNSYTTGIVVIGSSLAGSLKVTNQWTWQNFENTGKVSGGFNQTDILLKTYTEGCNEEVYLYEDTLYHTVVFQTPEDNSLTGCSAP